MTQARRLLPFLIFAVIALAITLPVAFQPPRAFQSFWINAVWLEQFSEQLAAGNFYPRWLPDSHNGLGSPVFYYYPPLAFYISAIPDLLGLSPYSATLVGFTFGSFASGATMYWWLKDKKHRLLSSIIFMLMPYHLFDFWFRGALAEHMAIAFIPLLAIGMKRQPIILAIAYAGIIITHLPLALLASLFFIAPYGIWIIYKDFNNLKPITLGLTAGLLMSGVYLYPALALHDFRKTDELYRFQEFQAVAWSFFDPANWPKPATMTRLILITSAIALGTLTLWRRDFWPSLSLAVCIVISGALPIWEIPLLAMVQFPWRALPLAEFALVTALASASLSRAATAAFSPLLIAVLIPPHPMSQAGGLDRYIEKHVDVAEYLPPAVPRGVSNYSEWAQETAKRYPHKTFYFPSIGQTDDGLFLAGEPNLRRLPAEWIGLIFTLLGFGLTCILIKRGERPRSGTVAKSPRE
ncbi:MAG: hypothetical protein H2048_02640 [Erythrobacter sp.]|nr:hypothetical protein [Erythrobacter sp.]